MFGVATRLVRTWERGVLMMVLAAGCGGSSRPVDDTTQDAPLPHERAGAAKPPGTPTPAPAEDPRHEAMAKKVVAAVASGDYAQFDALLTEQTRTELHDITPRSYADLRRALEREGIDLATATLVRVETSNSGLIPQARVGIETVELFLEFEGREFNTHFNVMTHGNDYDLMGVASWVKWTAEAKP